MGKLPGFIGCLALAVFQASSVGCGDDDSGLNNNGNNNNQIAAACGDGERQGVEECDDGAANSDTTPDACRTDCRNPGCGDGVVDSSESCDDGPANSDSVPDACRTDCTPPGCGDGVVDVQQGESCDDGNLLAGDGCSPFCLVEFCGNGIVDPGEVCDDGNYVGGDGCGPACNSLEICGNGVVDITAQPAEQCDDGNHQSHDGCASGCVAEFPSWTLHVPALGAIANHGMVYDAHRDRLVVFGGEGFCGPFCNQTFEFDGERWRQVQTPTTPPGRTKPALAYDGQRQRVVMFGGDQASRFDDTWEYDGTDWTQRFPAQAPAARGGIRMVYDSQRGVTVLFGGYQVVNGTPEMLGDTWEYDGTDWVERTPAPPEPSPTPRQGYAMAYDAGRGLTVLQGGSDFDGQFGETWEWNGTVWVLRANDPNRSFWDHQLVFDSARNLLLLVGGWGDWSSCPPGGCLEILQYDSTDASWIGSGVSLPAPRWLHGLAFDSQRARVVVFGGRGPENHALSDTLAFDGSACMDITPATAPEPRERGALAFDSQRGQIVMFGGWDGSGGAESLSAALTWRFDEEGWLGAALPGSPPRVTGHSMAYDPLRDRVVLFGGGTEPPPSSPDPGQVVMSARTFEYDGAAWAEVFPSHAPQARSNHRLVFDTSLGKVLLFGGVQGMDPQSGAFGDTWIFDGADWTELNPIHSPPARSWFMLAHDETRQETLVHGGISDEVTALTDTWVFDGTDWVERHPVNAPSWRAAAAVGFDPLRKRVVLYGGLFLSGYLDDVWEWDGIDWTRAYSLPPPARGMVEMVYHRGLRQMVLFGGYNGQPFGDTWFYRYASQWPDEDCKNGVDDDGDGDVDCADPDCEGQGCPGGGSCAGGVCVTP